MVTDMKKAKAPKKLSVGEQRQALLDTADLGISNAKDALQELFDDLDEKRSNLEENFSTTERYSRYEEACSAIEEAISTLDGLEIGIELP